jgi:putative heme-binding domain-containing protein
VSGFSRTASFSRTTQADAVARGQSIVESHKCLDCHRIGDRGSHFGPDLSDVGGKRTPEALRRSILSPDEEVLPEHRLVRVVTREGATVVGRLLNQDAFSIQVITDHDELRSFAKSHLRQYTILTKGLMPSFARTLSADQVADLVAYLASLKRAEP